MCSPPPAFNFLRITTLEKNAKYTGFNPTVTKIKLRDKKFSLFCFVMGQLKVKAPFSKSVRGFTFIYRVYRDAAPRNLFMMLLVVSAFSPAKKQWGLTFL